MVEMTHWVRAIALHAWGPAFKFPAPMYKSQHSTSACNPRPVEQSHVDPESVCIKQPRQKIQLAVKASWQ